MPRPQYDTTIPFAGLTRFNAGSVPEVWGHGSAMKWWTSDYLGEEASIPDLPDEGLVTVINELPRAASQQVRWEHPFRGETLRTEKHNAVYNPERLENIDHFRGEPINTVDDLQEIKEEYVQGDVTLSEIEEWLSHAWQPVSDDGERREEDMRRSEVTVADDALYHIPTDTYSIYNPTDILEPLGEVIREEDLGEAVFGEFRLSRDGGRTSADVFFDTKEVAHPEFDNDRKPIVVGVQADWDYFGDTALRIQGMALDGKCVNALRGITDKVTIKHTGDPEDRTYKVGDDEVDTIKEVWETVLELLDLKIDTLSHMIAEAMQLNVDFSELPDDFVGEYDSIHEAFFAYAGFPHSARANELAAQAGKRLRARADDPYNPSAWDIHSAATYAITHYAKGDVGKQGGSIERYQRIAEDMLMNPDQTRTTIVDEYEREHEEDEGTLSGEGGGKASINQSFEGLDRAKEQIEERREEMKALAVAGTEAE